MPNTEHLRYPLKIKVSIGLKDRVLKYAYPNRYHADTINSQHPNPLQAIPCIQLTMPNRSCYRKRSAPGCINPAFAGTRFQAVNNSSRFIRQLRPAD